MYKSDKETADVLNAKYLTLKEEIGKRIVGQEEIIKNLIIAILCKGHSLLLGVPGLAKTLLVNTLAEALSLSYKRIQFTPDLMPSDIIGSEILNNQREFQFHQGPIFANLILADEINRTPPKTQAALLEAMQERSVTAAGETFHLDEPFFVLATQNPIEQEGTYPLPEAQLDRFMFNLVLDYPSFEEEVAIVKQTTQPETQQVKICLSKEELITLQELIPRVPISDNVLRYAVELVSKTRPQREHAATITNNYLRWGAGPRASQYLTWGAKAHALLNGKYAPDIADVRAVAIPVLSHRIVRNYKAEADNVSSRKIICELMG